MSGRSDGAVGVFAAGLALAFVGLYTDFTVPLLIAAGLLMIGAVAAAARQRRTGPPPEVTLRPGGMDRPWRKTEGGD